MDVELEEFLGPAGLRHCSIGELRKPGLFGCREFGCRELLMGNESL